MSNGLEETTAVAGKDRFGLPYRWVALTTVCLGAFLETTEVSGVNVALPALAHEFDTDLSTVIWLQLTLILVSTGLVLTMGRIGDQYGRSRLFSIGMTLFTIGLAFSAIAGSLAELLAARVAIAIGIAMVLPNMFSIITASFPARDRGMALGIQGATVGAGLAVGPILAGLAIDALDWRAIFWARLPLSVAATVMAYWLLRDTARRERPQRQDLTGALLLFGLLFALVLGINRGDAWGWADARVAGALGLAAVLLAAFVATERRAANPIVALQLFRLRRFAAGASGAVIGFGAFGMVPVLIPFYLIEAQGFSTLKVGAVLAAMTVTQLFIAPIAGRQSDRIGTRLPTALGLVVAAVGVGLFTTLSVDTALVVIVLCLVVLGVGIGIWQSPNNSTILGSVPRDRLGTASATIVTARQVGQAISIAIGGALFSARSGAVADALSPLGIDDPLVTAPALLAGLELAFLVAAGIALLAAIVTWLGIGGPAIVRRARQPEDPVVR